jgi:ubiquitin-protein ligase
MDFMKVAITGVDDTPYAFGFFIFDSFIQSNYPSYPPKMNLMTTGKMGG